MIESIGRFHLVVLHLPIGFLLLAFLMELAVLRGAGALRPAVGFALFWGMAGAVVSAVLGYLLSLGGGYDEALLRWHLWLGIATAGLSVLLYGVHKKSPSSPAYRPLFALTLMVLAAAGHFGGSLTHGSGYLFQNNPTAPQTPPPIADLDSALVFDALVLPVLKKKCGGCHNPSKRKGGLALLTRADILRGGKNGPVVQPDHPAQSPFLLSIQAPMNDDRHMPPRGKAQLTDLELSLLAWWATSGSPFDKTVAESSVPAEVLASLAESQHPSPLEGLNLSPVTDGQLRKLREQGIAAYPLAQGSPFLQVSFSGKKDISPALLAQLKKVGNNIVRLDLAASNVDDAMLSVVKDLPHLNRLYLQQTAVTDNGLAHLTDLAYLEYLNLHQTKVTDAGLEQLKQLPALKNLHLWQTGVSEQGIARFVSQRPGTGVETGGSISDSMFTETALRPPVFKTKQELFTDSLLVELEAGFGKAEIRYTTDGSDPDSSSHLYNVPIVLHGSAEVRAKAYKTGWQPSDVAARKFLLTRYDVADVHLARQPDPRYAGKGPSTLTNRTRGGQDFKNGEWLGFQGLHCEATLDLGRTEAVSKVSVGVYEDTGAWIFYPKGLRVSVSTDGVRFKKVKETSYPIATGPTLSSTKIIGHDFAETQARFVKVEVLSALKNPAWHPGAGKPCWIFVDEIVVE